MTDRRFESRVREYRGFKGLSQEDLAIELGVSRQTVVNIERGVNEPRVFLAIALASALGVTVEQLFVTNKGKGMSGLNRSEKMFVIHELMGAWLETVILEGRKISLQNFLEEVEND